MDQDLQRTIVLLSRTPAVLNALLRDLPDEWTRQTEGGNTWSAFDVVGHLLHGERTDWMPRVKIMLQSADATKAFAPFDRKGHLREVQNKSLGQLLDEFASLRKGSVEGLQILKLKPEDLKLRAQHPTLGEVALSELLATWAVHDLTHLHQISRVMANQYRRAVGPWSKYLGVLHCTGHSV